MTIFDELLGLPLWVALGTALIALTLFVLDALIRRVRSLEMRLEELERTTPTPFRTNDDH